MDLIRGSSASDGPCAEIALAESWSAIRTRATDPDAGGGPSQRAPMDPAALARRYVEEWSRNCVDWPPIAASSRETSAPRDANGDLDPGGLRDDLRHRSGSEAPPSSHRFRRGGMDDSRESGNLSPPPSSPSSASSSSSSSSSSSLSSDFPDLTPRAQFESCNLSDSSSAPSSPLYVDRLTEGDATRCSPRRSALKKSVIAKAFQSQAAFGGRAPRRPGPYVDSRRHVCEEGPDLSEPSSDEEVGRQEFGATAGPEAAKSNRPAHGLNSIRHIPVSEYPQCSSPDQQSAKSQDGETSLDDYNLESGEHVLNCAPVAFELEEYGIGFQEEVLGGEAVPDIQLRNSGVSAEYAGGGDECFDDDDAACSSPCTDGRGGEADVGPVTDLSFGLSASPRTPDDRVIIDGQVTGDDEHLVIDDPATGLGRVWSCDSRSSHVDFLSDHEDPASALAQEVFSDCSLSEREQFGFEKSLEVAAEAPCRSPKCLDNRDAADQLADCATGAARDDEELQERDPRSVEHALDQQPVPESRRNDEASMQDHREGEDDTTVEGKAGDLPQKSDVVVSSDVTTPAVCIRSAEECSPGETDPGVTRAGSGVKTDVSSPGDEMGRLVVGAESQSRDNNNDSSQVNPGVHHSDLSGSRRHTPTDGCPLDDRGSRAGVVGDPDLKPYRDDCPSSSWTPEEIDSLQWCEEVLEASDMEQGFDMPSPLDSDIQTAGRPGGRDGSPSVIGKQPADATPTQGFNTTSPTSATAPATPDGSICLLGDVLGSYDSASKSDTTDAGQSPLSDLAVRDAGDRTPEPATRRHDDESTAEPTGAASADGAAGESVAGRGDLAESACGVKPDPEWDAKPVRPRAACRTPAQFADITPILQRFYANILGRADGSYADVDSAGSPTADSDDFRLGVRDCDTCSETDGYEDGATPVGDRLPAPGRVRRRGGRLANDDRKCDGGTRPARRRRGLGDDGKSRTLDLRTITSRYATSYFKEQMASVSDGRWCVERNARFGVIKSEPAYSDPDRTRATDGGSSLDESSVGRDPIASPRHEEVTTCHPSPERSSRSVSADERERRGPLTLKICRRRRTHYVRVLGVELVGEAAADERRRASRRMLAKIERLNGGHQERVSSNWHGGRSGRPTRLAKLAMRPVVVLHRLDAKVCRGCRGISRPLESSRITSNYAPEYTNMVRPVRRRKALPSIAINLWTAIRYIRAQKQIPNIERISRYMQREHSVSPTDTDLQLKYAVEDQLIVSYTTVGFKGAKVGMEQEGFKVPEGDDEEFERDGHDWYCFDCHQPGEVILCSECWRVYHPTCTEEEWTGSKFVCSVCKNIKKQPRMKRKEINRLLAYTILRLKEKTKELHSFGGKDDELKVERFIYKYVDLNVMEEKTKERKYKYLEQFYADARTILHNTFICYGDNGNMAGLAKTMIRDCKYDLDEIRQCKDCYHYSNAKPKDWFCQPCRPPHQLVYAKQKGFCYWPAKVIKVTEEGYDVRFFGGWHQRAILQENYIKPIDASVKSLTIKRTAGFIKAMNELKRHQDLIERMSKETEGGDNSDMEAEEEEEMEQPEIKHKKFRHHAKRAREEEVISSTHVPEKAAPTPEDVNMVTSSEDNVQTPRTFSTSDIGVQTSKKLIHPGKQPHKATQTDAEVASLSCNCDVRYAKIFSDFKERIEDSHKEEKEKALKELEERLRRDMAEQKSDGTSHPPAAVTQRELDQVRQVTEERCKEQYLEEIKKLTQKHKAEISATKKKQWCYNCEEEAMYHCCWNTSYCSIKCQQEHWHREHKRMCRRKRN